MNPTGTPSQETAMLSGRESFILAYKINRACQSAVGDFGSELADIFCDIVNWRNGHTDVPSYLVSA